MVAEIYTIDDGEKIKAHKSIPERSIESQLMAQRFQAMTIGEIVGYPEASVLIGSDAQTESRHLVYTAIKDVLDNQSIHIVCIPGVGWTRITDSTALRDNSAEKRAASMARCRLRVLKAIEYESLDQGEKILWNAKASHMNLLRVSCKAKSIKKLEQAFSSEGNAQRINLSKTLAALGWKGEPKKT